MNNKQAHFCAILENYELLSMFDRVAKQNGHSAETVLSNFIKDYIVSGGHPEQVSGGFFQRAEEQKR